MRSRYTITLVVVTAAIVATAVSASNNKLSAKKAIEQTTAPAESHDEEAVIPQPLGGAIEGKNGKQNQRAALAAQPGVAAAADWQPYGSRYAIIVMGDGRLSDEAHWPACTSMYRYLLEIGFIRENIHFLAPSRYARGHPDIVSDEASETRIEQAYQWAISTCTQADLLYVYWISHGTSSYFTTARNPVRHSMLASWIKGIKARQIIGVYQPCYSGAVVDDISGENIITLTSTDPNTVNVWPWAENIAFALAGPRHCDRWINPNHNYNLEPARYYVDQDGDGQVSVTEAYIWVAKHGYAEGSMLDDNGDGVGGQWMTDTFDPYDPDKDGYIGNHYSLIGWKPSSITLREYGHEPRKAIASARKIVDELHEKDGLYCNVIDKLKADKTLDEPVSKVALKIANSRKWQDTERLTKEGWEIVSSPDNDIDAYKSVLEKTKKVTGLEFRASSILTILGVGQYRLGAYADALGTLKQAEKMWTDINPASDPNITAFIAMTQYQLGQIYEGRSTINTFRDGLKEIKFVDITSGKLACWIEAEKVFAGAYEQLVAVWDLIGAKKLDRAVEMFTEIEPSLTEADSDFAFSLQGISRYLSRACYAIGKSRILDKDQGYIDRASDYEAAFSVDPNYLSALKDLAWLQMTCPVKKVRNFTKAVELATQACALTDWKNHECISILAAAYSETGDFDAAVKWQKTATALLLDDCPTALRANYEARCGVYQSHKPYHKGSLWSFSDGELVAHWKFDEVKRGEILDSTEKGLHGRLIGGAHIVSDVERGSVLRLPGKGDYVDCGWNSAFDITGSITIAAWTKVTELDSRWEVIVSTNNYGLGLLGLKEDPNHVAPGYGYKNEVWIEAELDVDNQWHLIVGLYDGQEFALYIDGKLCASKRFYKSIAMDTGPLYIGQTGGYHNEGWKDGLIDDVRIYSYALSPEEVKTLFEGKEPPKERRD